MEKKKRKRAVRRTGNPNGRPLKIDKDVLAKLEAAFSLGCKDLEACLHADIHPATLYKYQIEHPEFTERKAMLKDKMIFKSRVVVNNALNDKDVTTAKWYLERQRKDEFATRLETTGKDGDMLTVANVTIDADAQVRIQAEVMKQLGIETNE